MHIVVETALFCALLVVPALIASSFKSKSASNWFPQEENELSAKSATR